MLLTKTSIRTEYAQRLTAYTKRKKDVIEFDFGDSGKTAYFAV
jgi:hypothetical protein